MTTKRVNQPQPPAGTAPAANPPAGQEGLKALPKGMPQSDSGQPGGGRGRVDVTGIIPEEIRIDPDLTEGHPGYDESGDSEIIPPGRLAVPGGGNEGKADLTDFQLGGHL
jgi:hypothetical protein